MPIGTLMKKIDSQPMPSVSAPPTSGPMATAAPIVAPQIPNAVPRSRPWKARGEQRQRGGEHRRAADALQRAREVEHRAGWSTARSRSEATVKIREADDEDVAPPDAVGERAPRSAAARRATSA